MGPKLSPAGFFLIRTPALAFNNLTMLRRMGPGELEEWLDELLSESYVRLALELSSTSLMKFGIPKWRADPESRQGVSVRRSLLKYIMRMSSRPTPFGLLATYSFGTEGPQNEALLAPRVTVQPRTRLDFTFLNEAWRQIVRSKTYREQLEWNANPTTHYVGDRLHYVMQDYRGGRAIYELSSVPADEGLRTVMAILRESVTWGQMGDSLANEGYSTDDIQEYLHMLADSGIIIPEGGPNVLSSDPLEEFAAQLEGIVPEPPQRTWLLNALERLKSADSRFPDVTVEDYAVPNDDSRVASDGERSLSRSLYLTAERPCTATLTQTVLQEVASGVELLQSLTPTQESILEPFKEDFVRRYDTAIIPLLAALNPQVGVGLRLPARYTRPQLTEDQKRVLARLVATAVEAREVEVKVSQAQLARLAGPRPEGPATLAAVVRVAAPPGSSLEEGDYSLYIEGSAGPPAAVLMSRFAQGYPRLRDAMDRLAEKEAALWNPVLLAEVSHLPPGRLGNVMQRPQFDEYVIPLFGGEGPGEKVIPLGDLFVGVEDGEVLLFSKAKKRRVVPRLPNAHNFLNKGNLSIYVFLAGVSRQHFPPLGIHFGDLALLPFLPRLRYKRLVLTLAQWILNEEDLTALRACLPSRDALSRWRRDRQIPELVETNVPVDRSLVVDLTTVPGAEILLHEAGEGPFSVREVFPPVGREWVSGSDGSYAHQLIVPLITAEHETPRRREFPEGLLDHRKVSRDLHLDDGLVYMKVYCGSAAADEVLLEDLRPLLRSLTRSGVLKRWFFVRYGDPEFHLRVRLFVDETRVASHVWGDIVRFEKTLRDRKRCHRFQLDTYHREIERYGGPAAIDIAESVFHADSEACMEVVSANRGWDGLEARRLLGLRSAHLWMNGLDLPLDARLEFLDVAPPRKRAGVWSKWYRQNARHVEQVVFSDELPDRWAGRGWEALDRRSKVLQSSWRSLSNLEDLGRLTRKPTELLSSFMHMSHNRLLWPAEREWELQSSDILCRLYRSRLARRAS